jgi:haloalkane dehalogenase
MSRIRPHIARGPAMAYSRHPMTAPVGVHRTPDERFAGLPGFPFEPHYRDWQGMRLAHLDEGEGAPVVMLHGEPTWSYLYRKVMGPLVDAGYRCIVPDLPGFGRSDKPLDEHWYSYDSHTEAVASLLQELDLVGVTLVMQDWGGPIGLRVATIVAPERVARLVAMDTGVFDGRQQMSEGWHRFREFVARTPDLPIGVLIRGGCKSPPPEDVLRAYEAPFPDEPSKAGARIFPALIPLTPDAPGAAEGREVMEALARENRPTLVLWADSDPALPLEPVGRLVHRLIKSGEELKVIADAGHYLQEDRGEQVGALIAEWLNRTS